MPFVQYNSDDSIVIGVSSTSQFVVDPIVEVNESYPGFDFTTHKVLRNGPDDYSQTDSEIVKPGQPAVLPSVMTSSEVFQGIAKVELAADKATHYLVADVAGWKTDGTQWMAVTITGVFSMLGMVGKLHQSAMIRDSLFRSDDTWDVRWSIVGNVAVLEAHGNDTTPEDVQWAVVVRKLATR